MRAAPLDAGWAALSGGDWERARASFEESLAEGETPEALEGMGWVGHMLDEDRLTFDARGRAYRLYLERGDKGSAARIAAWLAADGVKKRKRKSSSVGTGFAATAGMRGSFASSPLRGAVPTRTSRLTSSG